jgi:hypothetical protein
MQTLNVGAGRTDTEYKDAAIQHRADLLTESQNEATYFFWAAGLAALATGLLPIRLNILVNVGLFDLLRHYGWSIPGSQYVAAFYAVEAAVLAALIGLGFAARSGQRWAFIVGIVLYAADMAILIAMFSIWAFGVHAFFLFRWFQGQKALKDRGEENPAGV